MKKQDIYEYIYIYICVTYIWLFVVYIFSVINPQYFLRQCFTSSSSLFLIWISRLAESQLCKNFDIKSHLYAYLHSHISSTFISPLLQLFSIDTCRPVLLQKRLAKFCFQRNCYYFAALPLATARSICFFLHSSSICINARNYFHCP